MRKKITFLLIIIHVLSQAQTQKCDSLRLVLRKTTIDTNKINLANFLASELIQISELDSATKYTNLAFNLAIKLNYKSGEAKSYQNFGNIALYKSDFPEAKKNYNLLLTKQTILGNISGIGDAYNCLGVAAFNFENYPEALDYSYKALKIREQCNDSMAIARINLNIGNIYHMQYKHTLALKQYNTSLKIVQQINPNSSILANIYLSIAAVYNTQKNFNKCILYQLLALNIFKKNHNVISIADSYSALGSAYSQLGNFSLAGTYLNKAIQIQLNLNEKTGLCQSLFFLGELYFKQHNFKEAENYLLKSYDIANEIGELDCIKETSILLSQIYEHNGNINKAFEFFKKYTSSKDSLFNEENTQKTTQIQMNYEFEKKEAAQKALQLQKDIKVAEEKRVKEIQIIALAVFLLVVIVIGWLLIRQNKLKAQQQAMQLEQKLLRSQMNPHFIFNCLQAIQNFTMKNNGREATFYLSAFGSLTRSVLENSRTEYISISKEISLLEHYLNLLKLLYGQKFNYTISVSPQLDTELIFIPPMLAQPFIENAVEHGFRDIQQDGLIEISFSIHQNKLLLQIKDNGSGINNTPSSSNHQSLSTQITKERIALFNKKNKNKASISIQNAFPDKQRKGVLVSIILPLL